MRKLLFSFGPFCDCLLFSFISVHLFLFVLSTGCVLSSGSLTFPRYFLFLNQLFLLDTREFLNQEVGWLIPLRKVWSITKNVVPRLIP